MLQLGMIERVKAACHEDDRIHAAAMFGSFAIGEGDAFSDIEFAVFIRDDAFEGFDQRSWLDAVSPVAAYFPDVFGHHTALFENGVRGEFQFKRRSDTPIVSTWQGHAWFPSLDAVVVLDRSGELSERAGALVGGPPNREGATLVEGLVLNLCNLMLMGANLLVRGEHARAWTVLCTAHELLLKLVRLDAGATDHWPTPSRALEKDLSAVAYQRYVACTSSAESMSLRSAYRNSWIWSLELFGSVATPLDVRPPATVLEQVRRAIDDAMVRHDA